MNAYVIDIESESLYIPSYGKIWDIIIKKVGEDKWLKLNPFRSTKEIIRQQILDFIFEEDNPIIITQNGLGFDLWVLWKEYDLEFQLGPDTFYGRKVTFFDTLYASQFLLPDRDSHSLKSWGVTFNDHKIDYYNVAVELGIISKGDPKGSEFSKWTPQMTEYCSKDCLITEKVYLQLSKELDQQNTWKPFYNGQKGFYLMQAQSHTGFKFDLNLAHELKDKIQVMIKEIKDEIEPELPRRKLKKAEQLNYIFPASIYKKDGSLSANMLKFIEKHNAKFVEDKIEIYGKIYDLIPKQVLDVDKPMSLNDQQELKSYFIENGWVPTLWNYKKDPKTNKKLRDENNELIPLSPKIQETQKICPNLLELEGNTVQKVVKFLSLKNRLSTLISSKNDTKGWINNPRLKWDGRISASASGIASTHRWKHTTVCC